MTATEFNPGDVVQVKSGGPSMTVAQVSTFPDGTPSVICDWFEGTKKCGGVFRAAVLEHTGRGDAEDEDGDNRKVWVVAEEILPVGAGSIPRQQWRYLELWMSDDPLLEDPEATRIAKTPDETNGWLYKWDLVVDQERGPVAQVANGIVLGTRQH